jgi:hypothetical protein
MTNFADIPTSLFTDSFHSQPVRTVTLRYVLESIRTGNYARQVGHVREILATQGKGAYDKAKAYLPAVTFGGVFFPSRGNTHVQKHSGLAHGDLDHIADIIAAKRAICRDPRTAYVFVSPSGSGLKLGVRIPIVANDAEYKRAWAAVAAEYERLYGIAWDQSGKDVSRLCFVSFDPELFVNFDAVIFDIPHAPLHEAEPRPPTPIRHAPQRYHADRHLDYAERAIRTATAMIQAAPMGTRHHTRLKAARLLGGYVAGRLLTEDEAYRALKHALEGHTENLSRALKTVEDGLAYGKAHAITIEALEAERQSWLDQHFKNHPSQHPSARPTGSPWDGINTLPIRPFARHRRLRTSGRQVRHG